MNAFDQHPTVVAARARAAAGTVTPEAPVSAAWLRELCLAAGADDVGFVALERPEVADQVADIRAAFPPARALISLAFRLERDAVASPARSAANLEFHSGYEQANHTARSLVASLREAGLRAFHPAAGFPMEMDRFPGKTWVISHKTVAVAAGLGQIGIHRSVIHPRFGSFQVFETLVIDRPVDTDSAPVDFNPCLECKLCVAACPVGALAPDGRFDFSACMTHNYREFMSGFTEWVETIAESGSARGYRRRVTSSESASMWQSLAFGPDYKAAYCLAVCPAGEDVIGPFLNDRAGFVAETLRPLQDRAEPLYVVAGSDAEEYAQRRFPHKPLRRVKNALRPTTIAGFLRGLPLSFQRGRSKGIDAVFHFRFQGAESLAATVTLRDQKLKVETGLAGVADVIVTADSHSWLRFLEGDAGLLSLLVTGRLKVSGARRKLAEFRRCFPR